MIRKSKLTIGIISILLATSFLCGCNNNAQFDSNLSESESKFTSSDKKESIISTSEINSANTSIDNEPNNSKPSSNISEFNEPWWNTGLDYLDSIPGVDMGEAGKSKSSVWEISLDRSNVMFGDCSDYSVTTGYEGWGTLALFSVNYLDEDVSHAFLTTDYAISPNGELMNISAISSAFATWGSNELEMPITSVLFPDYNSFNNIDMSDTIIYAVFVPYVGDGDYAIIMVNGDPSAEQSDKYAQKKLVWHVNMTKPYDVDIDSSSNSSSESTEVKPTESSNRPAENSNKPIQSSSSIESSTPSNSSSKQAALEKARQHVSFQLITYSYESLINILENIDGFAHEDAVYAADNCGANWNDQCLRTAQNYMKNDTWTRDSLQKQLLFEKFTTSEVEYALNGVGL